ncbi:hypothetical protein BHM03_00060678 [Ensete ventricosum]|nr:hypothetical protein BHM03_00060678 [Ensete ventricosum]
MRKYTIFGDLDAADLEQSCSDRRLGPPVGLGGRKRRERGSEARRGEEMGKDFETVIAGEKMAKGGEGFEVGGERGRDGHGDGVVVGGETKRTGAADGAPSDKHLFLPLVVGG